MGHTLPLNRQSPVSVVRICESPNCKMVMLPMIMIIMLLLLFFVSVIIDHNVVVIILPLPIPRNALSVRWFIRHVFYPQRDNGAQSERLLSDSRRCLVKPIVIGWSWVTRPERPKGVKDVIKQARRAAAEKSGPGGPLDF